METEKLEARRAQQSKIPLVRQVRVAGVWNDLDATGIKIVPRPLVLEPGFLQVACWALKSPRIIAVSGSFGNRVSIS